MDDEQHRHVYQDQLQLMGRGYAAPGAKRRQVGLAVKAGADAQKRSERYA